MAEVSRMFYLCDKSGKCRVTQLSFRSGGEFTFWMDSSSVPVLFESEEAAMSAVGLIFNAHLHSDLYVKSTQIVPVRRVGVFCDV